MKRGRSRLDALLRVARVRERRAERELVETTTVASRAEREAEERQARYEQRPPFATTDVVTLHRDRQTGELRAEGALEAEAARREAAEAMLKSRSAWLAAARARRTLEELEERDHAAHAMVAARSAQRALDDLSRLRKRQR